MSCTNCSGTYTHSNCGCGTCEQYLFTPRASCHCCPEPPLIEPCGRTLEGMPIYHELHPLIPMAGVMRCGVDTCLSLEQLACNLKTAESFYSTCDLNGDRYYRAIIYHALAMGDLAKRLELYYQSLAMGVAIGKESKQTTPDIYNSGFFGIQLKALLSSSPKQAFMVSI